MNIHNKNGQPFQVDPKVLTKLYENDNFQTLMNWVEDMLTKTPNLVSDKFFHPSFTKTERDYILGIIYTIYPNVKQILPLGPDGVIIKCDSTLDREELQKIIDDNSK